MTDSAAWVLMNLKAEETRNYMKHTMKKLFFADRRRGFSASCGWPMGASDYTASATYYTYCDVRSPDLSRFFRLLMTGTYILPVLQGRAAVESRDPDSGLAVERPGVD